MNGNRSGYPSIQPKKIGAILSILLYLFSLVPLHGPVVAVQAAAPAPEPLTKANNLTIEPITAYNVVVDSNVLSPSSYGPTSATIGAKFCNTGGSTLDDVIGYIGTYQDVNPAPGVYPRRDPTDPDFIAEHPHLENMTISDYGGAQVFRLEHEAGTVPDAEDASRHIGSLAAGECKTQYWLISYPRKAKLTAGSDWENVTGTIKPDDDLWLEYDLWATTSSGAGASHIRRTLTMRNEISAMANKIWPNGDNKVPDQYKQAINAMVGWDLISDTGNTAMFPGQTIISQGIWYDFGNVGAGFDNDQDFLPDRNAWIQPVGDHSIYDPGCFRLVKVFGLLIIKLNDGTEQVIPFTDRMYFENIPATNNGAVGLVYYQYLSLNGACSANLTPYQEVASGFDNEKFNADFGAGLPMLQSQQSPVTLTKNGPTSISLGGTATYDLQFSLPKASSLASALSIGNGKDISLTFEDTVPEGLIYQIGSAAMGDLVTAAGTSPLTGKIFYSIDSGATWSLTEPAGNTLSTAVGNKLVKIRWVLDDVYTQSTSVNVTGTVTFNAIVPASGNPVAPVYPQGTISNTGCLKFSSGPCFVEASAVTSVVGDNSLFGYVFSDTYATGVTYGDGTRQAANETGINGMTVDVYLDLDKDGAIDTTDVLFKSTTTATNGIYLGYYTFTGLPDGKYIVKVNSSTLPSPTYTGYTLTPVGAPVSFRAADLDSLHSNSGAYAYPTSLDFGYVVPLVITKALYNTAASVSVGDTVQFQLAVSNKLMPTTGPDCTYQYSLWPTTSSIASSSQWVNFSNATGIPDLKFATLAIATAADPMTLSGFSATGLSGTITSIQYRIRIAELTEVESATIYLRIQNATATSSAPTVEVVKLGGINPAGDFPGVASPTYGQIYTFTGTLSPNSFTGRTDNQWQWSDIGTALKSIEISAKKSTGNNGSIGIDSEELVVTTSAKCGTSTTTLNPVDLVDTYNNTELEFVSASLPVTSVAVDGTDATLTHLRWSNVGPIDPQQVKLITVKFKALKAASPSTNNVASLTPKYENGSGANPVGNAQATVTVTGGSSLSGMVYKDVVSAPNPAGWNYYSSGTVNDVPIAGALVRLFACMDSTGAYVTTSYTGFSANNICTTQGTTINPTSWQLVAMTTTTTSTTSNYSFTSLHPGFYYIQVNNAAFPTGFTAQTAEATDTQTVTGVLASEVSNGATCGTCNNTWGDITLKMSDNTNWNQLTAGENISGINFGYTAAATASINGFVFLDSNNDHSWDLTSPNVEPYMGGVTVNLYDCSGGTSATVCGDGDTGSTVATTTTSAADGAYAFSGLTVGKRYRVTVVPPTPAAGSYTPSAETGPAAAGDLTAGVFNNILEVPSSEMTNGAVSGPYNFGYFLSNTTTGYTIGDTLFFDWNGDSIKDAEDEGIKDVTVYLYKDDNNNTQVDANEPLMATAITTSAGYYSFTNLLADNYNIIIDRTSSGYPAGRVLQTYDPDESMVCATCDSQSHVVTTQLTNEGDRVLDTQDFGYKPSGTASLGDMVFVDLNGDGIQSGSREPGIGGIGLSLEADLNNDSTYVPIAGRTTTTCSDSSACAVGSYLFSNLIPGAYRVVMTHAGNTAALPDDSFGNDYTPTTGPVVTYSSGNWTSSYWNKTIQTVTVSNLTADFGLAPLSSFGDMVYWDANGNGTQDATEKGIGNVTVLLKYFTDVNNNGRYDASAVTETFTDSISNGHWDAAEAYIDLNKNGARDAGEPFSDTVGNGVWTDADIYTDVNGNGVYDNGEPITNDRDGDNTWDRAESYIDLDGSGSYTIGEPFNDRNGTYDGAEAFVDSNANGKLDVDEPIGSQVATKATCNTPLSCTVGSYMFTNLKPGNYVAQVDEASAPIAGRTLTADPSVDGEICPNPISYPTEVCDARDGMRLLSGANYTGADFGFMPTGRIGDTVWIDTNLDNVRDSGELGIPGLVVLLCSADDAGCVFGGGSVVDYTYTDTEGQYSFSALTDGTYYVKLLTTAPNTDYLDLPANLTPSYEKEDASPDDTTQVTLTSGAVQTINGIDCPLCDLDLDFGFKYPDGTSTIEGTVCLDYTGGLANGAPAVDDEIGICGTIATPFTGVDPLYESSFGGVQVMLYRWVDVDPLTTVQAGELTLYQTSATNSAGDFKFEKVFGDDTAKYIVVINSPQTTMELTTANGDKLFSAGDLVAMDVVESDPTPGLSADQRVYQKLEVSEGNQIKNVDFAFQSTVAYDFGDLLDTYSTMNGSKPNGARHVPSVGLFLGPNSPSTEENGKPSLKAIDDDFEDGAAFNLDANWNDGSGGFCVVVNGSGYLLAWVDKNQDGDFAEAGELVANRAVETSTTDCQGDPIVAGAPMGDSFDGNARAMYSPTLKAPGSPEEITFSVPLAQTGDYGIRLRLFSTEPDFPTLAYMGPAVGGEVEDYVYNVTPTAVSLFDFTAAQVEGGVVLNWSVNELDQLGYNLYRRPAEGGDFVLLTAEMILSHNLGDGTEARYEWTDTGADVRSSYVYQLEAVNIYGGRQTFEITYEGQINLPVQNFRLALPLLIR